MFYHRAVQELDDLANKAYAEGRKKVATQLQIEAGNLQNHLLKHYPRRYLSAQWVWAYGHIGLLQMLIRWFRKTQPEVELIIETQGRINNQYFFKELIPYLTVYDTFPPELKMESENNAVYFGCPDGKKSIHNFYKQVYKVCPEPFLKSPDVTDLLTQLGVCRPYTALHARQFEHDPSRNVSLSDVQTFLTDLSQNIISIGLDDHKINDFWPNVKKLANPWLASFQLSASCDSFIGSNSGAWTVANAYGKPVTLINDWEHKAWIYPEEVEE